MAAAATPAPNNKNDDSDNTTPVTISTLGMASEGVVNFVSGTAGGIAQVLVGHPFDTLKVCVAS